MLRRQLGFSLIELMTVVMVIGILAAIAIPRYMSVIERNRTLEAKQTLADMFTAQESFHHIFQSYATCLGVMGVAQETNNYYAYGFDSGTVLVPGLADQGCNSVDAFVANKTAGSAKATGSDLPTTSLSREMKDLDEDGTPETELGVDYVMGAAGVISSKTDGLNNPIFDQWTINHEKSVKHEQVGH